MKTATAARAIRAEITRAAARGCPNAAAAAETLRDEPHLAAAAARARRTDLTAADRVWTADLTAAGWDADSL